MPLSRRRFLRNMSFTGAAIRVGLPPLAAMFNANGTAYAATAGAATAVQSRFVFWFNGNGIPERYWIPTDTGTEYELTPCLAPLASLRNDIHVISGIDNPNARVTAPGNTHHKSMSALVSGTPYTGRGAGGASIDQVIAGAMGGESRFRSLQVGVCQESHGENIHRNLSWAGADRALPPEMIPHNLFDRLFGVRDQSWVSRKKSVLDAVQRRCREPAAVARPGGSAAARRAPDVGPRARARDREPAVRLRQERQRAGGRRRPDRLPAHREDPVRPDGACARVWADARRLVHADQVPEPRPAPVARLHAPAPSRLHPHERRLTRRSAHHARYLPLARRGVRLPPQR